MESGRRNRKEIIIDSVLELDKVADAFLASQKHPLVLLRGDLGAGKTSFVKRLLQKKGCIDSISSPSYSLVNEYIIGDIGKVFHIDLYRLASAEEAFNIGLEEYLYSGYLCLVEWPQIIFDYIEEPFHIVDIEILDGNRRKFLLS